MKKKAFLGLLAGMAAAVSLAGCGEPELALLADEVYVELGTEPAADVSAYVNLDAEEAAAASLDLSAVDVGTVGSYPASVTLGGRTVAFEVCVQDTTPPEVETAGEVVVAAGTPLYARDVITGITEASGAVEMSFEEPVYEDISDTEAAEAAETIGDTETTETIGDTETTETIGDTETTETIEDTEDIGDTEAAASAREERFILSGVDCADASVVYEKTGEYDNVLTVTDASGNSAEIVVHIAVGEAPVISGVRDLTVTDGAEEPDYLKGITAVDWQGNDITQELSCDASAVDLEKEGAYEISYTVTDADGFSATETAKVTVAKERVSGSRNAERGGAGDSQERGSAGTAGQTPAATTDSGSQTQPSGDNESSGAADSSQESGNAGTESQEQAPAAQPSGDESQGQTSAADSESQGQTPAADSGSQGQTPAADSGSQGQTSAPDSPSSNWWDGMEIYDGSENEPIPDFGLGTVTWN